MLFQSEIITAASGSVGGVTYSHTRSGMYRRAKAIPVNKQSPNQNQVRNALSTINGRWIEGLTEAQRAAWRLYAQNVPTTNALGASILLSGQNWFIAANVTRLQAKAKIGGIIPIITNAPTIFNRGDYTDVTLVASSGDGIAVTFDEDDDWNNENNSHMFIYQGRPQNGSRKFFKGPWRLIGIVDGNAADPGESPHEISQTSLGNLGWRITTGQHSNISTVITRNDGRISTRRKTGPVLVT